MAKISDDLREFADAEVLSAIQISDLKHMAKRIDAEMVELPKDADGEPIHVGDTVYLDDGCMARVTRIELLRNRTSIVCWTRGKDCDRLPSSLTHERHDSSDSWERIAQDMEDWSDDNRVNWISDVSDRAAEFAYRIRKLAKKEGER